MCPARRFRTRRASPRTFGAQFSRDLNAGGRIFGRVDVAWTGKFDYDELNTASQDDYAITNFRAGWRGKGLMVEGWIRNAFDTQLRPAGLRVPRLHAVRLPGRAGTATDDGNQRRCRVLTIGLRL